MSIDLSQYNQIQTNLFVKIDVPGFEILTFTDYFKSFTIGSDTYVPIGNLLSVSDSTNELRATPKELTISISGIPEDSISDVLENKFRGSTVEILRGFFEVNTGEFLNIQGNPSGMFQGVVSNFQISDDLNSGDTVGRLVININCTSFVDILANKVSGRRTNPIDFDDESMDRVTVLAKSNFNFGSSSNAQFGNQSSI